MAPVFGSRVWQRRHFQKLDFAKMKRSCCCCLAASSSAFFLFKCCVALLPTEQKRCTNLCVKGVK